MLDVDHIYFGEKFSKWAVYGQLYNIGLIMRKPNFVGCEQQWLRSACASIGLINALKSMWKVSAIKKLNLIMRKFENLAIL